MASFKILFPFILQPDTFSLNLSTVCIVFLCTLNGNFTQTKQKESKMCFVIISFMHSPAMAPANTKIEVDSGKNTEKKLYNK